MPQACMVAYAVTGPVTAYATMQACGIVNDHLAACFCRDR